MFLKECEYVIKETKTPGCITDDRKICSVEEIADQERFNKEKFWGRKL